MSILNIAPGRRPKRLTGSHVLAIFLAFFGVVFLVNGIFMYLAISTHTGIDTSNAYRRGLDYNRRIKSGQDQAALGWSAALALAHSGDKVTLRMTDESGFPVPGLLVTGLLARPVTTAFDQKLAFDEISPGNYAAGITKPAAGNWIATAKAARMSHGRRHIAFRLRKRLWLKPKD